MIWSSGCKVQGSGFRVQGSGFRVQGSGFKDQGSGFRVQGSGFNAWTVVVIHAIEMVLVVFGGPFRDEKVRFHPLMFLPCSCGEQRGSLRRRQVRRVEPLFSVPVAHLPWCCFAFRPCSVWSKLTFWMMHRFRKIDNSRSANLPFLNQ